MDDRGVRGREGTEKDAAALNLAAWDADVLRDLGRAYAIENLGDSDAILVADPTGFAKKGRKSSGVQRQYSGTVGRVDNCQIGTFLAYVNTAGDRVLIDRELYIPEKSWFGDQPRCTEAAIPPGVEFATRPTQVITMLQRTAAAGVGFRWFTADEEFAPEPGPARLPAQRHHRLRHGYPEIHRVHRRHRPNPSPLTTSPNDYDPTHGPAAPVESEPKATESTTGRSSTPPSPAIST